MKKLEITIDSTSLGYSNCILNFHRTIVGSINQEGEIEGGYRRIPSAAMIYGVAGHGYINAMFRSNCDIDYSQDIARQAFDVPKEEAKDPATYLNDVRHLLTTCYYVWDTFISKDPLELIQINRDGKMGPATEINFKLLIYEDDFCVINLAGTMDALGKFIGGCYTINDLKFTRAWNKEEYLDDYELSRQLRIYVMACKLMADREPDSTIGKVGATKMGACISGIFLKPNPLNTEFKRSKVFLYSANDLADFSRQVLDFCARYSKHLQENYFPKEGILNGTCDGKWKHCAFWNVCKSPDNVGQIILKRDFKRKIWNPLCFND